MPTPISNRRRRPSRAPRSPHATATLLRISTSVLGRRATSEGRPPGGQLAVELHRAVAIAEQQIGEQRAFGQRSAQHAHQPRRAAGRRRPAGPDRRAPASDMGCPHASAAGVAPATATTASRAPCRAPPPPPATTSAAAGRRRSRRRRPRAGTAHRSRAAFCRITSGSPSSARRAERLAAVIEHESRHRAIDARVGFRRSRSSHSGWRLATMGMTAKL